MNGHVLDLLGAYLDGELNSYRRQKVETHLNACSLCRSEYEGLCRVSQVVRETPAPEFTPVEQFAAQVALQLSRQQVAAKPVKRATLVWWIIPVILLGAWFFVQTAFALSRVITVLDQTTLFEFGVFRDSGSPALPVWFAALLGILEPLLGGSQAPSLSFLREITATGREMFGGLLWQAAIALLYLAWLAVWWFRRIQPGNTGNRA